VTDWVFWGEMGVMGLLVLVLLVLERVKSTLDLILHSLNSKDDGPAL